MLKRVARVFYLNSYGLPEGPSREIDAGGAPGPVRLEVEVGKSTACLQLQPEAARQLGRALLGAAAGDEFLAGKPDAYDDEIGF